MNNLEFNENKEIIKKDINAFCNELYSLEYSGYVNTPVVIVVYLGDESYQQVNASLKDAFTTSFSNAPSLKEIVINQAILKDEIVNEIKNAIMEIANQGKSYNDIRIAFITLMNDVFYDQNSITIVDNLKEGFKELEYLGLNLSKKALYGLFNQNQMNHNYQNAFKFVEAGKEIWKNIFHIEIPFVDTNLTRQAQLIALNLIRDDYNMKQTDNEGYCWTSLYLHYLRISEFITCRLLREIYGKQIDSRFIDSETFEVNVNQVLDKLFGDMLVVNERNSYQYVPLNYQAPEAPKKKGFLLFKKNTPEKIFYNKVLKDENVVKNLVDQLYENIAIDDHQYQEIIKQIISSSTSIDCDPSKIGKQIVQVLTSRIEKIDQNIFKLSGKKVIDSNLENVDRYLSDEYNYHQQIIVLNKEKDILKQIIKNISNDSVLKQIINEIVKKNHFYANILDELTLSEYGGTLEVLNVQNLPSFSVNLSVKEILNNIDKQFVNDIINNNQSLSQRLKLFLNHTVLNDVSYKHSLGIINRNFTDIKDVFSYLLLPASLSTNQDINNLVQNYDNLLKNVNDLYRDNSFFIISTRSYDSDQYIVNYKRGE
ncbi:MAG: hypothetical protein ACLRT4_05125 [Thomasclavelia sp.]